MWPSASDSTSSIVGCTRTVCNFVAELYILLGVDHDLLLTINCDDLGSAVRVTRVVDQPPRDTKNGVQRVITKGAHGTYPRFPFFVASTTKSSSIRNK